MKTKYQLSQKQNKLQRLLVLVIILILSTIIGLLHQFAPSIKTVGVDALCPFGAIESAYTLITLGSYLPKIVLSSLILLTGVLVVAIVFRRSFCGLICPLGTIQELFASLGNRLFNRKLTVKPSIDKPARFLKYIIFVLIIVFTAIMGELVYRPYDPWAAYHHLFSADLFSEFPIGFATLILAVFGSVFYDRIFCKYLCPMGGFLGMISGIGMFKIMRDENTCINCKACDKICPVNVTVSDKEVVTSAECINCNECVNVCPSEGALNISRTNGSSISSGKALLSVVLIFMLVVGSTTLTGSFKWTQLTLDEEIQVAGSFNPELIKGRMTLQEVSGASGIPTVVFKDRFNLSDEDIGIPIKDFANKYDFETEDVQEFISEYLNETKS